MTEYINNLFGIENEISVPILISLIVFIIGGLSSILLTSINNYFSRLQIRKSFTNIIEEITIKSKRKSNHIKLFFPTLNIENNNDWSLKFMKIPYLGLAFQQDLTSVFNSFRIKFKFRIRQKIRFKAYNKIWSYLENLRFYENRIITDFERFGQNFNKHENAYYSHLEELRKENDKKLQPLIGQDLSKLGLPENESRYIKERSEIFYKWQSIGESTRRNKSILFHSLVEPLYELNLKNQKVNLTIEQNTILLAAKHEYEQLEKLLSVNNRIFYDYYFSYKFSYRMLEECLKRIK